MNVVKDMKAYSTELVGLQSGIRFLVCSQGETIAAQLAQAVGNLGVLTQELPPAEQVGQLISDI